MQQRLFFIIGKGGVGRSSVSASLASYFAQKKEKVLVVQWSLSDSISSIFSSSAAGHKESKIEFTFLQSQLKNSFHTMNFKADEAIKEYFVDHLKMKLLYSIIIQNKHVQKLVHAAPGISELFFLGRLFWLSELAQKERGFCYDRIIIDTPATGHGVSLFGIAKAVASLGMTGPLAMECERVSSLLGDRKKTTTMLVTLPEELPMEECIESFPIVVKKLGFKPSYLLVNQSVHESLFPNLVSNVEQAWSSHLTESFSSDLSKKEFKSLVQSLLKRNQYEKKLHEFASSQKVDMISVPDFNLVHKKNTSYHIVKSMTEFFMTSQIK